MEPIDPTLEVTYIRRVLGATGDNAGFVTDTDIAEAFGAILPNTDWRLAAAYLADSLAARAINDPMSFSATGDMSISWANRAQLWSAVSRRLRLEYQDYLEHQQQPTGIMAADLYRVARTQVREYASPRYRYLRRDE